MWSVNFYCIAYFCYCFVAGTFCALDICISRLEDTGLIDVRGTVEKIRSQRAYSIQMPDQYIFCHLALIEYALAQGYLQSADLAGFSDDKDDDSDWMLEKFSPHYITTFYYYIVNIHTIQYINT